MEEKRKKNEPINKEALNKLKDKYTLDNLKYVGWLIGWLVGC